MNSGGTCASTFPCLHIALLYTALRLIVLYIRALYPPAFHTGFPAPNDAAMKPVPKGSYLLRPFYCFNTRILAAIERRASAQFSEPKMPDLSTAAQAKAESLGKKPEEIHQLILDGKCTSSQLQGLEEFSNLQVLSLGSVGLRTAEGMPSLPKLRKLILPDNRYEDKETINHAIANVSSTSALSLLTRGSTAAACAPLATIPARSCSHGRHFRAHRVYKSLKYLRSCAGAGSVVGCSTYPPARHCRPWTSPTTKSSRWTRSRRLRRPAQS